MSFPKCRDPEVRIERLSRTKLRDGARDTRHDVASGSHGHYHSREYYRCRRMTRPRHPGRRGISNTVGTIAAMARLTPMVQSKGGSI